MRYDKYEYKSQNMHQFALRSILLLDALSTVITPRNPGLWLLDRNYLLLIIFQPSRTAPFTGSVTIGTKLKKLKRYEDFM